MSADLDHTIVHVRNRQAAAAHLVEMLNLDPAVDYGPFAMVRLGNQAVLAFADTLGRPRQGTTSSWTRWSSSRSGNAWPTRASPPTPTQATRTKESTRRGPRAAEGSTGTIRTATHWRSSPSPAAAGRQATLAVRVTAPRATSTDCTDSTSVERHLAASRRRGLLPHERRLPLLGVTRAARIVGTWAGPASARRSAPWTPASAGRCPSRFDP